MVKICKQCGKEKDIDCFKKYSGRKPYSRFCIECLDYNIKDYTKKYYIKNREKRLDQGKKWRENNKEYHTELNKIWRDENPNEVWLIDIKKRAKKRGLDFSIDISDLIIPEFCPILGIPIFRTKGKYTPNSPSLDRIDSSKGYLKGNVQVISHKANTIKNDASLCELVIIGEWAKLALLEHDGVN